MGKSSKKTRRFLKRVAERKGLEYGRVISSFYGKSVSEIDRNIVLPLMKEKPSERIM